MKSKKVVKNEKKKKDENKVREYKTRLKFNPLNILITVLVSLIIIGLSYYFLGLIPTLILIIGSLLILLIGHFLDKPKKKSKMRKAIKIICIIGLVFGILGLLGGCLFMAYIVNNAPDFQSELLKKKESTIIYDNKGVEMAKLGTEIRENIEYDEISENFIDALVATEDSKFFQHNGLDLMRFTKAAIGQVLGKSDAGGGSTLTMQVSKNTFTSSEDSGIQGIIRKFTDIYVSMYQIERNYTKEQIIEFYINNHSLYGTISGIQEASQYFFEKDAKDLNLAESSLLAGLYKAPTYYNPYIYPERATKRRNTVLYLMERHGYITNEERKLAASIPVESLLSNNTKEENVYQGYIDLVCQEIKDRYGVDPYTTPMLIYTNMDRSKQDGVNDILNGKTYTWKYKNLQTGIAVVDSSSGKIEAIGAGRNRSGAKSMSFATDINRQIGSTAKPLFDYAPGMEYNNWSTYTLFDDEKGYTYSDGTPINNFDGNWEGVITLRRALSNSRNIPALKAFQQVDNKKIVNLVTKVGIKPEISNGYIHEAHAIGAFTGSNPLTMAGAYQIFSNGGYYYEPYAVNKVVFRSTGETDTYSSAKVKVISDSTAYMITDVLKGVVDSRMKNGLYKDHFAAKTGTTNVDSETKKSQNLPDSIVRDYWVNGYTHNVVISIWIGFDKLNPKYNDGEYLNYNADGNMRRYLLNAVGKVAFNHDNTDFTQPKSVVKVGVENQSNPAMLPSANTPKEEIVYELFKKGTEPTEVSKKFLALDTPTNLQVKYADNAVKLTWTGVSDLGYLENGQFGYYIYINNEKVYFTENTNYTISNLQNFIGTYSVRAGYKDTEDFMSGYATYELKSITNYKLSISGKATTTYKQGEAINKALYDGTIVVLSADGKNITSQADIDIIITDSNNETVTTIDKTKVGTYTITYKVSYDGFEGTCSNKIIIEKKEENPKEDDEDDESTNPPSLDE